MPLYFGWGDRKLNIIHSRLRNMCSSLNADLHLVNLTLVLHVSVVMVLKTVYTFFLECPFYNEIMAILYNKLKNYIVTIELILAGDENLTPNQNIEIFSDQISKNYTTVQFNFLLRVFGKYVPIFSINTASYTAPQRHAKRAFI